MSKHFRRKRAWPLPGAFFLLWLLTGCASLPMAPTTSAIRLEGVPAFAQQDLQCGPAALASLLNASGVAITPETLTPDLFIPARNGSLQVELIAQARQRQRVPLLLEPSEPALIEALEQGDPALVLLNLGLRTWPTWHYAAVVGYDPAKGYLLNNGKAEAETVTRSKFLRQWQWADRWGLTLHRADSPPSAASAAQWINAVAPLERSHPEVASTAYHAAIKRWPEAALPRAALGVADFRAGLVEQAVLGLREAARLAPDDAAIANNLASVELSRGCVAAARAALAQVDATAAPAAVAEALAQTRAEIEAAGADRCISP